MPHALPPLPYSYDALEPHIDALTMEIHHSTPPDLREQPERRAGRHALCRAAGGKPAAATGWSAGEAAHPGCQQWRWACQPLAVLDRDVAQGGGRPDGDLGRAIDEQLGGFEAFKDAFTKAALTRFGSGWAWLSVTPQGSLLVESSGNQDSPLMNGNTPILGLDVWEHAYYLKYQNRRPEYIGAFYNVIDWREVARRYAQALA